jgi:hypothetical protein
MKKNFCAAQSPRRLFTRATCASTEVGKNYKLRSGSEKEIGIANDRKTNDS